MERESAALHAAEASETRPVINAIGPKDLKDALSKGLEDFSAKPSHAIFLTLIYPIVCIILITTVAGRDLLPLLFPLIAGFSLLGPLAAVGLYELSRRREQGLEVHWSDALAVLRSPTIMGIAALGVVLMGLFFAWLYAALLIFDLTFADAPQESLAAFFSAAFTTVDGWILILVGNAVGFVFALVTLAISAVSFPMLLDREVDAVTAALTSIRAVVRNPRTMALWGLYVAGALVVGFLPFAVGLAIVLPVLGHATWHLYRKVVSYH